ncbi:hypothetical protein [Mycoplasma sp. Mirounga ES2805-ORL]|uniref:hypothetical protein n=1 Tax=Mycoplasma sp. Mirounga ES2805-ORL TaxID=754514 RepID=UPI00197B4F8C|nr:hypothetical protein [Mycoplasma sp. Mirounga ES2805-ORL]QSF13527.1 hypothetical protein JXZ90_02520 [Mycoplasma sp. Mirounga ES2805-ORL]
MKKSQKNKYIELWKKWITIFPIWKEITILITTPAVVHEKNLSVMSDFKNNPNIAIIQNYNWLATQNNGHEIIGEEEFHNYSNNVNKRDLKRGGVTIRRMLNSNKFIIHIFFFQEKTNYDRLHMTPAILINNKLLNEKIVTKRLNTICMNRKDIGKVFKSNKPELTFNEYANQSNDNFVYKEYNDIQFWETTIISDDVDNLSFDDFNNISINWLNKEKINSINWTIKKINSIKEPGNIRWGIKNYDGSMSSTIEVPHTFRWIFNEQGMRSPQRHIRYSLKYRIAPETHSITRLKPNVSPILRILQENQPSYYEMNIKDRNILKKYDFNDSFYENHNIMLHAFKTPEQDVDIQIELLNCREMPGIETKLKKISYSDEYISCIDEQHSIYKFIYPEILEYDQTNDKMIKVDYLPGDEYTTNQSRGSLGGFIIPPKFKGTLHFKWKVIFNIGSKHKVDNKYCVNFFVNKNIEKSLIGGNDSLLQLKIIKNIKPDYSNFRYKISYEQRVDFLNHKLIPLNN